MKLNSWTKVLILAGVVSLRSAALADGTNSTIASPSSSILSGFVDTSAQWNLGQGDSHAPAYKYGGASKADGFNLNVVGLDLLKPIDDSSWAAGYEVELWLGPDANVLNTASSASGGSAGFAVKQAYVNLLVPLGTGLELKAGVFDSIIGYESSDAMDNANFTRSWGHTFEPSTHTGLLANYKFCDFFSASAGVADQLSPGINGRSYTGTDESFKTYMGAVTFTAPPDYGFLSGSMLHAGIVNGYAASSFVPGPNINGTPYLISGGQSQTSYYLGVSANTPLKDLKVGFAFDYAKVYENGDPNGIINSGGSAHSFAGYASYKVSDKLSIHERAEYADLDLTSAGEIQGNFSISGTPIPSPDPNGTAGYGVASSVFSLTTTVDYDLWKNVLSRLELRWDHACDGSRSFGGTGPYQQIPPFPTHNTSGTAQNSWIVAVNFIFKF